jgi:L-asparaginase
MLPCYVSSDSWGRRHQPPPCPSQRQRLSLTMNQKEQPFGEGVALTGVNGQLLDRLEQAGEIGADARTRLQTALGSSDNHTRAQRCLELIDEMWRRDRGLGVPPFLDVVRDDEQDHAYYTAYRDHVVHSLQVYLLGLDIYCHQPSLRNLLNPEGDGTRFRRQWMIAAFAHDHGYVAEVPGRFELPPELQRRLEQPLSSFADEIRDGAQLRLAEHILRHQPAARFFDELQGYQGESLLDAVASESVPVSLGTGRNPLRQYFEFAKEQGWGGRDHGLVSVLLILQLRRRLESLVAGIEWDRVPDESLTAQERQLLKELPAALRVADRDVLAACGAIAVHNIRRTGWSEKQLTLAAAQFQLSLGAFRIELTSSPLAWFLALCDTLQCWNRPRARGGSDAADVYLPESGVRIEHEDGRILVRFTDEDEYIEKTGTSRFYKLRLELVEYLDAPSVDAYLTPVPVHVHGGFSDERRVAQRLDEDTVRKLREPVRNWSVPGPITPDMPLEEVEKWTKKEQLHPNTPPVCVLYTGGSVGMVPKDPEDEKSPLITKDVMNITQYLQRITDLPFDIHFWETPDPLDSSNIQPEDWVTIARIVQRLFPYYQGFVVLHGTDTMTYTASALSFLFRDLSKPVLLTGAERPIAQLLTDAVANIMNALQLAAPQAVAKPVVPEVCIYFGGKLIRGNRAKKVHSLAFAGFDSPNCELLGTVEDKIDIHTAVVRPAPADPYSQAARAPLHLTVEELDHHVAIFEIYPSTDPCLDLLEHMLTKSDQVRAVVLKTYGTGNAPTLPERFLKIIEAGVKDHGRLIVNLTSCPAGQVEVRLFETNARLFELGVINGGDMTSEAAATKLMWLLARHARQNNEIDREAIIRDMQIDQRGELRYSVYNLVEKGIRLEGGAYAPASRYIGEIEPSHIDHAYVRVHGIRVESQVQHEFQLGLYFQSPRVTADTAERLADHRIGTVRRDWEATDAQLRDGITFNLDATQVVRQHLQTGENLSVQILPQGVAPVKIETLELAIFTENRARFA